MDQRLLILLLTLHLSSSLIPPKFQWKVIDFAWEGNARSEAICSKDYIPENNMPMGLARWKNKLFITIPRWKNGVPSSLNYIKVNGNQSQLLNPYPSWCEAFVSDKFSCTNHNSTVVNAFRIFVDKCDRLWVVDNGIINMSKEAKQITKPAILVFDLNTDMLILKYELTDDVLRDNSLLTSIVVDVTDKGKDLSETFAYITDSGANSIIVYSLNANNAWLVENHYFQADPSAEEYRVGGLDYSLDEGISGAALTPKKSDGYRDLYFTPTSSTKQFRISTKLLKNRCISSEELFNGVEVIGERGPKSQATACAFDPKNEVLFYTQVNKNGIGCWNIKKPFCDENIPIIFSDCNLLEFPNDVKVDNDGNLWILSDRQSRFLQNTMDFNQTNFRVLMAPASCFTYGTTCEKLSALKKVMSCIKGTKSAKSCSST